MEKYDMARFTPSICINTHMKELFLSELSKKNYRKALALHFLSNRIVEDEMEKDSEWESFFNGHNTCPICCEEFEGGNVGVPKCLHTLCLNCLERLQNTPSAYNCCVCHDITVFYMTAINGEYLLVYYKKQESRSQPIIVL